MTIKEYELPHDAIGREIGIISPHEFGDSEGFIIYFTDGTSLEIEDDPDCCEVRWMHTDDDLDYYAGSTLVGVELRDGPTVDGDCGEVEALVWSQSRHTITTMDTMAAYRLATYLRASHDPKTTTYRR